MPVAIPWVVTMLSAPDTPPTTPTESAETLADPPTVSAVPLLESSYRLQPLRATWALPCTVIEPLAVGLRESTQPVPPLATATARAVMVNGSEFQMAEN